MLSLFPDFFLTLVCQAIIKVTRKVLLRTSSVIEPLKGMVNITQALQLQDTSSSPNNLKMVGSSSKPRNEALMISHTNSNSNPSSTETEGSEFRRRPDAEAL